MREAVPGYRLQAPAGRFLREADWGVYQGRNRYTVMSRLYYWALAFQSMYPNEMRVYYETTDFVCFEIDQNPYRLFDLSIDYYGYNSKEY